MFSHRIDDHLELRLYEHRHAEELSAMVDADRAHARQWLPWVDASTSIDDSRAYIQRSLDRFAKGDGVSCGIWERDRLVGGISLQNFNRLHRKVEIGYWLSGDAEGRGIMTRSCAAMVDHAIDELKLHRVSILCASENQRSRAIPERLNFTQEGTARDAEWLYDHFVDLVTYSMLDREWPEAKNRYLSARSLHR